MINLEIPKKFVPLVGQAHQVAEEVFRPISRKYDVGEHEYPKELDMLAALIDGMNDGCDMGGRRRGRRAPHGRTATAGVRNGSNMSTVLGIIELCWGDVGLLLSMPRQGLGNSAIASVANDEQLERFRGQVGRDGDHRAGGRLATRAAIRTTAVLDEETGEYVLNGEKIYVTSGERADLVVVWATLDRCVGRAAIKSFVVERSNPGLKLDRLEHKLGIRASDTAAFILDDCRVPPENLLGSPEVDARRASRASCRRSTTRGRSSPRMAVGLDARVPGADRETAGRRGRRGRLGPSGRQRSPPRPPSTSRWRPTTSPPGC